MSNGNFNQNQLQKNIIILKKSLSITERKKSELIMDCFMLTSHITIKAINNFYALVVDVPKSKIIHDEEDITNECYIGLTRCVTNLKFEDRKKFHFYLNSAYNRIVYRIVDKSYYKHKNVLDNNEDNERLILSKSGYIDHFDLTDIDLSNVDLTHKEHSIMIMKVEGNNFQQFLKQHKMSHIEYKNTLLSLQEKIFNHYNNNE